MGTHQCTLSEAEKLALEKKKAQWLVAPKKRKKRGEKELVRANPEDYFFNRENLKIEKKGQLELL